MDGMAYVKGDLEARFWPKVNVGEPEECWEWNAALRPDGYGVIGTGTLTDRGTLKSNRAAWIVTHGDIPPETLILHTCDNRACCNPAHLFLGSPLTNAQDMAQKGRHGRAGIPGSNVRLTPALVIEMRTLHAEGMSINQIATQFPQVARNSVSRAIRGITWKEVC